MKTITLKTLSLLNFKGIRKLTVDFEHNTFVYGENAVGKSTIFDAFTYLLFGKNSAGETNFEVKTLDANNKPIPKIEHEVSAVLLINGSPLTLKRTLREKWVKKKGSADTEFTGNETLYEWNDVPVKAGEFQQKLSAIVDEVIFKLITNPMAFASMNWKEQRKVLIEMCGEVSLEAIAAGNPTYEGIIQEIQNKEIDLEEYRKSISARKKKIKVELDAIPTRIDEVQRNKPVALLFGKIREQITEKDAALKDVEKKIADKSEAVKELLNKKSEQQKEIHRVKSLISEIEHEEKQAAKAAMRIDYTDRDHLSRQVSAKQTELTDAKSLLSSVIDKITVTEGEILKKRNQWHEVNKKELTFNDNDFHCPTCKREFEEGDVESKKAELQKNFTIDKKKKLVDIEKEGGELAATLKNLQDRKTKGEELISKLEPELAELKKSLETETNRLKALEAKTTGEPNIEESLQKNEKYQQHKKELAELESNLVEVPEVDTKNLEFQKQQIQQDLDKLKTDLSLEQTIKNADNRIKELEAEEEKYSAQLMDIEGKEFAVENLIKLNIESLEEKINAHFKFVNFKLFSEQINGGVVETCEALIDGVPFSNANTASKINAGIDIINSLCEYYQVTAPIFIDNRESVVSLIDTDSQVINLIVTEGSELSVGKPKYTPEYLEKMEKLQKEVA